MAKETAGFSGADIANLINEAAILAAKGQKTIEMKDLEESVDKVSMGPERRSKRMSPQDKELTAYHEAGHALTAKMLPNADPPHKISNCPWCGRGLYQECSGRQGLLFRIRLKMELRWFSWTCFGETHF